MHRQSRTIFFVVLVFAIAGASTACTSTGDPIAGPGRAAYDPLPRSAYPNVVYVDGAEKYIVVRSDPIVTRDDDGVFRVRLPLRSTARTTGTLRYKFTYRDAQDFEFRQRPRWQYMTIESRTAFEVVGEFVDPRAEDFHCIIGLQK